MSCLLLVCSNSSGSILFTTIFMCNYKYLCGVKCEIYYLPRHSVFSTVDLLFNSRNHLYTNKLVGIFFTYQLLTSDHLRRSCLILSRDVDPNTSARSHYQYYMYKNHNNTLFLTATLQKCQNNFFLDIFLRVESKSQKTMCAGHRNCHLKDDGQVRALVNIAWIDLTQLPPHTNCLLLLLMYL